MDTYWKYSSAGSFNWSALAPFPVQLILSVEFDDNCAVQLETIFVTLQPIQIVNVPVSN